MDVRTKTPRIRICWEKPRSIYLPKNLDNGTEKVVELMITLIKLVKFMQISRGRKMHLQANKMQEAILGVLQLEG